MKLTFAAVALAALIPAAAQAQETRVEERVVVMAGPGGPMEIGEDGLSREAFTARHNEMFDRLDADHNGRVTREEMSKAIDMGNYYRIPCDTRDLNYDKYFVQGEKKVYLVLNKPKGYVTSLDDPHAGKTVMDLVEGACTERIYPVGRLDKNSLGLLLFTNDGDLTKQLTHPSYLKKKIYQVTLDKPLARADMDRIAEGITLEDGEIFADEISYVKENKQEIGIEIHSGRNRIVRRIFEFLGYTVTKLDRVYYAGLTKKNLKRGAWRFLSREEVERLKSGQYE